MVRPAGRRPGVLLGLLLRRGPAVRPRRRRGLPRGALPEGEHAPRSRDGDRRGRQDQAHLPLEAALMPTRTPEEIRASIEANRKQLGTSVERLRDEVAVLTDWRGQLVKHQKQVIIGAAVAGFIIGGGIAAVGGLFRRRR